MIGLAMAMMLAADNKPEFTSYMPSEELYKQCMSSEPAEHASCMIYILGALEGATGMQTALGQRLICVPVGTSGGQVRDAVVKDLTEPKKRLVPASLAVVSALMDAFPCKKP